MALVCENLSPRRFPRLSSHIVQSIQATGAISTASSPTRMASSRSVITPVHAILSPR